MKVLFVASEALPFASTGGLADVIGSLPPILKREGVDARVIIPYYSMFKQKNLPEISFMFDFRVQLAWRDQYCGIFTAEHNGVTFYFVDNDYYFKRMSLYGSYDDGERYAFFSKAVLDVLPKLENNEGFFPDIIHTNDWQTALVGIYLKQVYRKVDFRYRPIRVVHSIHNIEYQGVFDHCILGDVFDLDQEYASIVDYNGAINLTKGAVVCCDRLTTVSPTYANQIKTPAYASGLHYIINQYAFKTVGIINGIDQDYYDPSRDPDIVKTYKTVSGKAKNKAALQEELHLPVNPNTPMISMITRLTSHKGVDLVVAVIEELLQEDVQFVLLGTGDVGFEAFFKRLASNYPEKVRAMIKYDKALSKKIYAAADLFLMPSKSEPCGLAQMIASRYGAIPLVRETGGLYDTIRYYDEETGEGNGFTFANYNAHDMLFTVRKALTLYREQPERWNALADVCMKKNFSWDIPAKEYLALYEEIINLD
ncbi:MAG: glycogen synthase GlgA [Clostridia bacterium]|nr:glycogen synthase GlgA [Clostridia bacterium]